MRSSSMLASFALAASIALGCGGPSAPATSATSGAAGTSSATGEKGSKVLELGEAKIAFPSQGGRSMTLALHGDGTVEANGKTVGTLSSDGHLAIKGGAVDVAIDADGKVGKKKLIVIDADGTAHTPDKGLLKLDPDGHVIDDKGKDSGVTITAASPAVRRAAMFVLIVSMSPGPSSATSGPGCPMMKGSKMSGGPSTCACEDHNLGSVFSLECDEAGTKQCLCKKDGAVVKTIPAASGTCNDATVWQQKCGFPAHVEPAPEL